MEENYLEMRAAVESDCSEMGKNFVGALQKRTGTGLDVVGIPIALASAFDGLIEDKLDLQSFYLDRTVSKLVALRLERYALGIEALDIKLQETGATSRKNSVNNGGDNYVYSVKSNLWRHALICETQNRYFIVLMRFGHDPRDDSSRLKSDLSQYYQPKGKSRILSHAGTNEQHLPDWTDDSNLHGYVAFLKDGEVRGAIHHYGKICYCLYSLASFIECLG